MVFLQLLNNLVYLALDVTLELFFEFNFSSLQFYFKISLFRFILALTRINDNFNLDDGHIFIIFFICSFGLICLSILSKLRFGLNFCGIFFYFGDRDGHVNNIKGRLFLNYRKLLILLSVGM